MKEPVKYDESDKLELIQWLYANSTYQQLKDIVEFIKKTKNGIKVSGSKNK